MLMFTTETEQSNITQKQDWGRLKVSTND